jgi:hypothetical protein
MEDDKFAQSNYMGQEKNALCPGIGHRVEKCIMSRNRPHSIKMHYVQE